SPSSEKVAATEAPSSAEKAGQPASDATALLTVFETALQDAIAAAEPSIVAVARVTRQEQEAAMIDPLGMGRSRRSDPSDPEFIPSRYGTGVVIGADGLILTNYHVLDDDFASPEAAGVAAPQIDVFVWTTDHRVFTARILAADPRSDLAVLKVDASDLNPIEFAPAEEVDKLRKGTIVVALGNPYNLARGGSPTAAWGIISNIQRKAAPSAEKSGELAFPPPTIHHFGSLLQTDAKLTFGTSGGALVNIRGEMVGLTNALAALPGSEAAAGYAIPVDSTFRRVVETLREGREPEYGFLGVKTADLAIEERLTGRSGVRVEDAIGSPARAARLISGDVITSVNGRPIYDRHDLMLEIGKLPVEALARLTVRRRDADVDLPPVKLVKFPVVGRKIVSTPSPDWRGARIDYLTGDPRAMNDFNALANDGVLVADVLPDTPAYRAKLRKGVCVTHVGGRPVHSPREFREAVANVRGGVTLRIYGQAEPVVVPGS
ncbi:MAG TPA: trypsin-like peptidase domain-containing protein, partial [Pirellulales bacterium]